MRKFEVHMILNETNEKEYEGWGTVANCDYSLIDVSLNRELYYGNTIEDNIYEHIEDFLNGARYLSLDAIDTSYWVDHSDGTKTQVI